jgi:hypothetical protein
MKWSILLHDIVKRGFPEFMGRDHIHPFNGGIALLNVFKDLGFIDFDSNMEDKMKSYNKIIELLSLSY